MRVTTRAEQGQGISEGKGVVSDPRVSTQTKEEGCMAGGRQPSSKILQCGLPR